nr:MAG TPA: hypothetical protein [Caudoviricetes sp.]
MSDFLKKLEEEMKKNKLLQDNYNYDNQVQYRQEEIKKITPNSENKKTNINNYNSSNNLGEFASKVKSSLWDRVKERALQTDIKGVAQNFGLGAKGALTKTIYSLNKYNGTEKTLNNIYNTPATKQIKLEKTLGLINQDKKENNITNKNIVLPQKSQDNKLPILDNYEVKNEKILKEIEYINKYNNPIEIDIRKDNDKIQENIDKQKGILGKGLATVAPSIRRNDYRFYFRYSYRWWWSSSRNYTRIKCFWKLYVRC